MRTIACGGRRTGSLVQKSAIQRTTLKGVLDTDIDRRPVILVLFVIGLSTAT
jgi:hypothetical protein